MSIYHLIRDSVLPKGSKRREKVKDTVYKLCQLFNVNESRVLQNGVSEKRLTKFRINKNSGIVILTTPHCLYVAKLFESALKKIDIPVKVTTKEAFFGYEDKPYIVICPQMFKRLPKQYIAYQMEQTVSSRWFNKKYFELLRRSIAVFDYSLVNVKYLQENNVQLSKVYYLPISQIRKNVKNQNAYKNDILFYGDDNCPRRKEILDKLSKTFRIKIVNNVFGEDIEDEIRASKIVLNIHYYEGALLETTRIYECLSLGATIISETSIDMEEHQELKGIVEFVNIGDISALEQMITTYLQDNKLYKENKVKVKKFVVNYQANSFEFYFYRFLLATENITFDEFYSLAASYVKFSNNFWCLGLPEYTERYKSFVSDNKYDIEYFPGLRHYIGWIGCGLSYKFLLRKAQELMLENVTICEDDVNFPADFDNKLAIVKNYLGTNNQWDVFSGLMADVGEHLNVIKVEKAANTDFITVNTMVSMVFNIYNKSAFSILDKWDFTYRNVKENAIDRFIEKQCKLNVVLILPFLVGQKDTLSSTVWGVQNTEYNDWIAGAEQKLSKKVAEWKE